MEPEVRQYEITVIVSGALAEEEALRAIDDVRNLVTKVGGSVESERPWGKRTLQYQINNQSTGLYHSLVVSLPSEQSEMVKQQLEQQPAILRFLLTHYLVVPVAVAARTERRPAVAAPVVEATEPVTETVRKEKLEEALADILEES